MNDDTISRQAAIDAIKTLYDGAPSPYHLCGMFEFEDAIRALPSAERHGRWEMKEDPYGFFDTIPVCSVCGCTTKYRVTSTYCPNCGAKMDEVI